MSNYYIGFDCGTQGTKVAIYLTFRSLKKNYWVFR